MWLIFSSILEQEDKAGAVLQANNIIQIGWRFIISLKAANDFKLRHVI